MLVPLLLGAATPNALSSRPPALRVSGTDPVIVRGNGFRPSESVRVSFSAGAVKRVTHTRSSSRGLFTVKFNVATPYDPCSGGLLITAHGGTGDRASLKLVPRACPPAP